MTHSTDPADPSLIPDDEEGGALAVRHLLSTGRTRIGHVTGPQRFKAAVLRAEGAQQALAAAGLELAGREPWYGEWTEEWGRLLAAIDGRPSTGLQSLPCCLVVRDSSRSRHLAVPAQGEFPAANEAPATRGAGGSDGAGARVAGGVGGAGGARVTDGADGILWALGTKRCRPRRSMIDGGLPTLEGLLQNSILGGQAYQMWDRRPPLAPRVVACLVQRALLQQALGAC